MEFYPKNIFVPTVSGGRRKAAILNLSNLPEGKFRQKLLKMDILTNAEWFISYLIGKGKDTIWSRRFTAYPASVYIQKEDKLPLQSGNSP